MIVVNHNGQEHKVEWNHNNEVQAHGSNEMLRCTNCYIKIGDNTVCEGTAICAPADQYNKSVGRKLSLLNTLKNAGISKADRAKFWSVYLDEIGR